MKTRMQLDKVREYATTFARKYAQATAADVRRTAQRSIKSGGKSQKSKSWRVSKPGEPPASHVGELKRSINYEIVGEGSNQSFIVGAPILGNGNDGSAPGVSELELGGRGAKKETALKAEYFRRRTRRRKKGEARKVKPKATRPYWIYPTERGTRGKRVADYVWFNSKESWRKARASPRFQSWADSVQETTAQFFNVEARPFMRPALEAEAARASARANRIGRSMLRGE